MSHLPFDLQEWFELSYAQYLTVPRLVLQSMPMEWQVKMAALLREMDETFDWRPHEGCYWVRLKDVRGRFCDAPLSDYRHGTIKHLRRRPPISPAQATPSAEPRELGQAADSAGEADRNRLEQQEAEAQDKAHPQIRPMTQLENAYMDLEGKLGQANARIEALETDAPSAAEEEAAVAMVAALPDVLGAEILREYGVTIVATIKGEVYDETQMGRLLDAECAFLEAHPDCRLSFRYVPAALAAREKRA